MQQETTIEPKLSDLINLDEIKSLHAMSREEQEEKGEVFINAMMGRPRPTHGAQKTQEITPIKSTPVSKKVKESPEDAARKTWARLHHMLMEFKSSEEALSKSAGLVVGILKKLIQSRYIDLLEPHEIELLEMAIGHFDKLNLTTPFSCIHKDLGTDPETILKTFELLDEEINQDQGALFLARINTCFWTTVFLTDLRTVLQKILAFEGCLGLFTKEEFGTYPLGDISSLIVKPMQRMPRLAMFSTDWQNDLTKLSLENSPALTAVNNLDEKFKKVSQNMNRTIGFMEKKQEAMNKQKKAREENTSMADRLLGLFSKEDNTEKEAKLGEMAFDSQDVYRNMSKCNEDDLRKSRELRENRKLQQQHLTQSLSAPEENLDAAIALSLQTPTHESTPRPQSQSGSLQRQSRNNTDSPRRLLPTAPLKSLEITPTPQLQTPPSQQNLTSSISANSSHRTLPTRPLKQPETISETISETKQQPLHFQPLEGTTTPLPFHTTTHNTYTQILQSQSSTTTLPQLQQSQSQPNITPPISETPSRQRTLPKRPQLTGELPPMPEQQTSHQPNNTTTVNLNVVHQTQHITINNFYLGQQNTNSFQALPKSESEPKFKSQSSYRGTVFPTRKEKPVCSEASMLTNNLYTKMTDRSPLQIAATLPQITLNPTSNSIHITINATSLKIKEGVNLSGHSQFGQYFKPSNQTGIFEVVFNNSTELNSFLSSANINNCDIRKLYNELCGTNILPNESFFNIPTTQTEPGQSSFLNFSNFTQ